MDQNVDVVELVSNLLDSEKYKEVLKVPDDEHLSESFKEHYWDLTTVIIKKIENETLTLKPSLQNSCERLLEIIAEKAQPEEALLEFLEQIEHVKNDSQFIVVLNILLLILKKLMTKRWRSLEWCLNAINNYINLISIPEHCLEQNERLLLDSDDNIRRINKLYSALPQFYQPLIQIITTQKPDKHLQYRKEVIVAFLISLLGKPLIYMDLNPQHNANSEIRQSCAIILGDICSMEKNLFKFLPLVDKLHYQDKKLLNKNCNESDEYAPYKDKDKINITSLSGLFYIILSNHFEVPDLAIPQVYSTEYIVHTLMFCVYHLLQFTQYSLSVKGIALLKSLLSKQVYPICASNLNSPIYFDVLKSLVQVAVFSNYETVRKDAVNLTSSFVNKYDYKGRCFLLKHVISVANHSGMIGYAITLYKNSIDEAFKSEEKLPTELSGHLFTNMLNTICNLPFGAETDLIEHADQIISALNFLRYILIKDKNNITGIKDNLNYIENTYLSQLRIGLNMSKAHYEAKLKDLEEGNKLPEDNMNVSVNIGGNILDSIPLESKKEVILSSLNAFHLMEGLMAHVLECISVFNVHSSVKTE